MWLLRKDGHEAAMDLGAVPGVGAEIVLTVDGELRRTRLYRAHEQAELSGDCGRAGDVRGEGLGVTTPAGRAPLPRGMPGRQRPH
jgi:hypothetical protein